MIFGKTGNSPPRTGNSPPREDSGGRFDRKVFSLPSADLQVGSSSHSASFDGLPPAVTLTRRGSAGDAGATSRAV